jgi:hypothetical protein
MGTKNGGGRMKMDDRTFGGGRDIHGHEAFEAMEKLEGLRGVHWQGKWPIFSPTCPAALNQATSRLCFPLKSIGIGSAYFSFLSTFSLRRIHFSSYSFVYPSSIHISHPFPIPIFNSFTSLITNTTATKYAIERTYMKGMNVKMCEWME